MYVMSEEYPFLYFFILLLSLVLISFIVGSKDLWFEVQIKLKYPALAKVVYGLLFLLLQQLHKFCLISANLVLTPV